jgi:hypothetical protein
MKVVQKLMITLALILFSTSVIFAQDLSKYRNFSLGTSLASISKQVNATPDEVRVIDQSPSVIQELTWWPVPSYQSSVPADPVQEIRFSFYNGDLYRIVATYESACTQGLTAEDMVQAIAAKYGTATRPAADTDVPTRLSYSSADIQIALWENSQYSVTFSRSALSKSFQLAIFSKRLKSQADADIAEAAKQEREHAPQKEMTRVKKAADDLATMRQINLKAFRP